MKNAKCQKQRSQLFMKTQYFHEKSKIIFPRMFAFYKIKKQSVKNNRLNFEIIRKLVLQAR